MNEEISFSLDDLASIETALEWGQDSLTAMWGIEWMDWYLQTMAMVGLWANIFSVIAFALSAWGLYMINKKLGENHPWLAFIPIVQVWTYFTAAQKSFLTYFIYPFIALIVGLLVWVFTFWISIFVWVGYFLYCWIVVVHSISKRTWRWAWSTVWMIFVWFIMLPVIGYKLQEWDSQKTEKPVIEPVDMKEEL